MSTILHMYSVIGDNIAPIILGLLGGVVPALLWLWFWLKEDPHPEPMRLVIHAFFAGMLAVLVVIPFQHFIEVSFSPTDHVELGILNGPTFLTPFTHYFTKFFSAQVWIIILWAACEEIFKFLAAYWTGLKQKEDEEPIDQMIFLITAALGFAALENALFIFNPLLGGDWVTGLVTGNMRFIGATLLHTICSASIGVALGLSFYKSKKSKWLHLFTGLGIAIALHSAFNLLIMESKSDHTFIIFYFVWLSIIVLLLLFEKIKHVVKTSIIS